MDENDIVEKRFFVVGETAFENREEAVTHVRKKRASVLIKNRLELSDIYFRDTCADEIADWIFNNYAVIAAAVNGE